MAAIANLAKNVERAQAMVAEAVKIPGREQPSSLAHRALSAGLVTRFDRMDPLVRERL